MDKESFIKNLLRSSKNNNFVFLSPEKQISSPQRMSSGKQVIMAGLLGGAMSAALGGGAISGAFFGSMVGYSEKDLDSLAKDMALMGEYCDLVGIQLNTGACILRLLIDGDEIPCESLIGRFAMIHQRSVSFRKYSMVIAKNNFVGNKTSGTSVQVVVVFSTHKLAREFNLTFANKCSHKSSGGIFTSPWVVDLEDEEITPFQPKILGFIPIIGGFTEKHKKDFFEK